MKQPPVNGKIASIFASNNVFALEAANNLFGLGGYLLHHVRAGGKIGYALGTFAGAGHGALRVAVIGGRDAVALGHEQVHGYLGEVVRHADVGAGRVLGGVVCVLLGGGSAQPAGGADKAAGNQGAAVAAVEDQLLPQIAEVALLGGEEAGAHLDAVRAHGERRGEALRVTVPAGAADEGVFIGELLDDIRQQRHAVYGLPGGVEAALVAGGYEHLHAGLLAAGGGAHAGEDVHPNHALLLDEAGPGHGVAGGCDEDLEAFGDGRVLTDLFDGLHNVHGVLLNLGGDHDVGAENGPLIGLVVDAGEHLLEDSDVVVVKFRVRLLAEVLENDGVGLAGGGAKGAAQAEAAGVGGRDAEAGHGERAHTRLDDGVFDAYEFGQSGLEHELSPSLSSDIL